MQCFYPGCDDAASCNAGLRYQGGGASMNDHVRPLGIATERKLPGLRVTSSVCREPSTNGDTPHAVSVTRGSFKSASNKFYLASAALRLDTRSAANASRESIDDCRKPSNVYEPSAPRRATSCRFTVYDASTEHFRIGHYGVVAEFPECSHRKYERKLIQSGNSEMNSQ